jgi:hypothetical protein
MTSSKSNKKSLSSKSGGSEISPAADRGMEGRDYSLPLMLNITTPKNTSIDEYQETPLILPIGRINKLWIEFPKGCSGLVGFQIWRNPRQVFPIPEGQWMVGDNFIISLSFTHIVHTNPFLFTVRSYNLDDTYNHRIMIILEMSGLHSPIPVVLGQFLNTLGA